MKNDYENVDRRTFYSHNTIWAGVFGSSRYIKFINYRENIYYEYGKTYVESSKTYPKYF